MGKIEGRFLRGGGEEQLQEKHKASGANLPKGIRVSKGMLVYDKNTTLLGERRKMRRFSIRGRKRGVPWKAEKKDVCKETQI